MPPPRISVTQSVAALEIRCISNANENQDAGKFGLNWVTVSLLDGSGVATLATTTTDANGRYYFDCLSAGSFLVRVDTTGFPVNLVATEDPDASKDGESTVILGAGEIDLTIDFGFGGDTGQALGSIGTLVWDDENADGDNDGTGSSGSDDDELSVSGVTVDLYHDKDGDCVLEPGETKLASVFTTITSTNNDLFNNLPIDDGSGDMSYIVNVSDAEGVLLGYWHSLDPGNDNDNSSANDSENTSKPDTYSVTLTTSRVDEVNADFGYYLDPACVGNRVWSDTVINGLQDSGESDLNGVEVLMTISYPNGETTTLNAVTDGGHYALCNLLLDEDDRQAASAPGGSSPFHLINVDATQAALNGYAPTLVDQAGDDQTDSDNSYGTIAVPV